MRTLPSLKDSVKEMRDLSNLYYSSIEAQESTGQIIINDLVEWSETNRILRGNPFTLKGRPYLYQIYRDDAKELGIVKGRQTEVSEYGVNWLIKCLATNPNAVGFYSSDRASHVSEFSNLRVKEWAIKPSPAINKIAPWKGHAAQHLPFTNGSHLYFHSAFDGFEEARGLPIDFAFLDEIQSTKADDIEIVKQALSHSKFGFVRYVGTGAEYGSAWQKIYFEGTQYEWKNDHWEAKNPGATVHTYHIPQQLTPWFNITAARKVELKNYRRFVTEILGWWHKGAARPIIEEELKALFDKSLTFVAPSEVNKALGPIVMGIDWGGGDSAFTVPWVEQIVNTDLDITRLLYTTKLDERSPDLQAEKMINIIEAYQPDQVVMDAGGGPHQVERLENKYAWRTVKQYYMERPDDPIEQNELAPKNTLKVDRTWLIDSIIMDINRPVTHEGKILNRMILPGINLNSEKDNIDWVVDHFTNIEAHNVELASGRSYVRYGKYDDTQPNDALHAKGYAKMAWFLLKQRRNFTAELKTFGK